MNFEKLKTVSWNGVLQNSPLSPPEFVSLRECWRVFLLLGSWPWWLLDIFLPTAPASFAYAAGLWFHVYVLSARKGRHWKRVDARPGLLAPRFFPLHKDAIFVKLSVGSFSAGVPGVIFGSVTCWTVGLWFLGPVSVAWGVPSTPHRLPALGVRAWSWPAQCLHKFGIFPGVGEVAGDWVYSGGWGRVARGMAGSWNRSCLFCGNIRGWSEG